MSYPRSSPKRQHPSGGIAESFPSSVAYQQQEQHQHQPAGVVARISPHSQPNIERHDSSWQHQLRNNLYADDSGVIGYQQPHQQQQLRHNPFRQRLSDVLDDQSNTTSTLRRSPGSSASASRSSPDYLTHQPARTSPYRQQHDGNAHAFRDIQAPQQVQHQQHSGGKPLYVYDTAASQFVRSEGRVPVPHEEQQGSQSATKTVDSQRLNAYAPYETVTNPSSIPREYQHRNTSAVVSSNAMFDGHEPPPLQLPAQSCASCEALRVDVAQMRAQIEQLAAVKAQQSPSPSHHHNNHNNNSTNSSPSNVVFERRLLTTVTQLAESISRIEDELLRTNNDVRRVEELSYGHSVARGVVGDSNAGADAMHHERLVRTEKLLRGLYTVLGLDVAAVEQAALSPYAARRVQVLQQSQTLRSALGNVGAEERPLLHQHHEDNKTNTNAGVPLSRFVDQDVTQREGSQTRTRKIDGDAASDASSELSAFPSSGAAATQRQEQHQPISLEAALGGICSAVLYTCMYVAVALAVLLLILLFVVPAEHLKNTPLESLESFVATVRFVLLDPVLLLLLGRRSRSSSHGNKAALVQQQLQGLWRATRIPSAWDRVFGDSSQNGVATPALAAVTNFVAQGKQMALETQFGKQLVLLLSSWPVLVTFSLLLSLFMFTDFLTKRKRKQKEKEE